MEFPEKVDVTGQIIDISALSESQKEYFIGLKDELLGLYEEKEEDRLVVSLSGISGSGKSVTAAILENLISQEDNLFSFYALGLDAFHFDNQTLATKKLSKFKGRFDTYDLLKLESILKKFTEGEDVSVPIYSRKTHNPIDNSFTISDEKALLLMEGLWFLRDEQSWERIRKYFAHNLLIKASEKDVRKNVINRHVLGGRSLKDAQMFYEGSDKINSLEILENSVSADEEISCYLDKG